MSKKPNLVVERSRNEIEDQVNGTSTSLSDHTSTSLSDHASTGSVTMLFRQSPTKKGI